MGNLLIRALLPGYSAVEATMTFTMTMLLARLAAGAVSSLVAGLTCAVIAKGSRTPLYVLASIMVIFFVPVHYNLLTRFPLWYHAVFLGTLAPLVILGGRLRSKSRPKAADLP